MALSLGAQGISYLEGQQWEASVSYRYLTAESVFSGDRELTAFRNNPGSEIHSVDLTATYALNTRFSLSLTIPFVHAEHTSNLEHDGVHTHTTSAGGLGDVRLVGNVWLFDPQKHPEQNVAIGVGVKAPTGDHRATDIFYRANGPEIHHVVPATQPGDGGWGVMLELQAYKQLSENTYAYANGFYLISPRNQNGTEFLAPLYGATRYHSVPDQYLARAGLAYLIWPKAGLSLSLGGRIDGIPVHDLIGGSDGFRNPGFSVDIDPGLQVTRGKNTFTLSAPVKVYGEVLASVLDRQSNAAGFGGLADFLIFASYTRRF
ncbi:MAG: hypothetical protein HYY23_02635 [Verrucomicrobia bacterium]|nr:hypothetical protein [Verrucomicrobiota bacterium]